MPMVEMPRWVLPATILGSSLSFIDGSVVNVALPAMQRDFRADLATMQLIVNGYMLMLASLILLGGSLGDRFGRRRIFLIGLCSFAGASLACGLAPAVDWLIAARFVQGCAAALLVPASLAMIGSAYTGEARGRAIGTWAGAAALTTALGPPLGGWLIDSISWRAIFLINLPIAALSLLFALKVPADPGADIEQPLDLRGAAFAVLGLGLVSYGLILLGRGEEIPGAVAIAAAVPAIGFFIRTEKSSSAPMMPLSLFGDRRFSGANALTVLLYAALSGSLFLLPFLLIQVRGAVAVIADHGHGIANGRCHGSPLRSRIFLDGRFAHQRLWFRTARFDMLRPDLLGWHASRTCRLRVRYDDRDRSADHGRIRLRTEKHERSGLRHQQHGRTGRRPDCGSRVGPGLRWGWGRLNSSFSAHVRLPARHVRGGRTCGAQRLDRRDDDAPAIG
jgi:MFS family permease